MYFRSIAPCRATLRMASAPQPWLPSRILLCPRAPGQRDVRCLAFSTDFVPANYTPKQSDPLRILFCGSDEFSAESLKLLHVRMVTNPDQIRSIDVVVRPPKRIGRGLTKLTQPPIIEIARKRLLRVHKRDDFNDWELPPGINLIVAVSFGLFIPPRLLRQAKYGGLNVHPSLLPDLRGAAPLHHTLLQHRQYTGVTLQTLDHERFDHGLILSQTTPESMPIPEGCTFEQLREMTALRGAELLARALRDGLHVPPLTDVSPMLSSTHEASGKLRLAPKIRKEHSQLTRASVGNIHRMQEIIGPVWFLALDRRRDEWGQVQRFIVEEIDSSISAAFPATMSGPKGSGRVHKAPVREGAVETQWPDETWARYFEPMTLTMMHEKKKTASEATATAAAASTGTDITIQTSKKLRGKRPNLSPADVEANYDVFHLKAWVRKLPWGPTPGGVRMPLKDVNYVYLPDLKCRLINITAAGKGMELARPLLEKARCLTKGHDLLVQE
ncbi:formyl transferase [Microdochium trichocladiopsis]|uniref:methionyl-tRNA formyltransferase n=1 Tax=Microdochium trichocladiopsis TaxID=1682393 RepID=A0A9P8XYI9_9PEZI|nr:formyl transferase [Microdochium trichocladiopsis]KAH7026040.1 formyl transferase [Microdochium trichocladiopsis]